MLRAHRVADVRAAEAALMATVPPGTLMQRAATGLAVVARDTLGRVPGARVVVIAGSGDNGGDALHAGARLAARGAAVTAVLLDPPKAHQAGTQALLQAGGRTVLGDDAAAPLAGADLVLDGIVGIGGSPGLRPAAARLADLAAARGCPVVAVDLPSGVDPDTGEVPAPAFLPATRVVTFGTVKPALLVGPAADGIGRLDLVDIGLVPYLPATAAVEALDDADVAALLPGPGATSDKYSRGVVGVAAGSDAYTGAAMLCVAGALAGGAGMVRYVGPPVPTALVRAAHPEVVVGSGQVQATVVGPGYGDERAVEVARALAAAEHDGVAALVDADGLRHLPGRLTGPVLLTPHAGELARMLGVARRDVEARRLYHATAAASRWQATVLLKGSTTLVVAADGRVRANRTATPALATAGSGDVLAGLAGALLAAGLDPFDAGSVAAHVHGLAGALAATRAGYPVARDVAAGLPTVLLRLRAARSGQSLLTHFST